MALKRIFVTYRLPEDMLRPLSGICDLEVWTGTKPMTPTELFSAICDRDGIICLLTDEITRSLLETQEKLNFISSMSVGVDHIDLAAATNKNIPVGNTPGVLAETTADLAFGLLIAAARRIPEADKFVREGQWMSDMPWSPDFFLGKDVYDATLGVVGLGETGKAVARRGKAFGMRVLGWNRTQKDVEHVELVTLDELLAESDYVSIHIARTSETLLFFDHERIMSMKKGAILINTARGGIVDETSLANALKIGHLAAAGLDVFEAEPLQPGSKLLNQKNIIFSPHIGSATASTRKRMAQLAVENVVAAINDRPMPFCVNPEVYRSR
tara:strand:+ start:455 stop:1435 length:981 start_codon:yes stop_codon:yes gene_type:complete